jgi:Zn-dependent metalloprotease
MHRGLTSGRSAAGLLAGAVVALGACAPARAQVTPEAPPAPAAASNPQAVAVAHLKGQAPGSGLVGLDLRPSGTERAKRLVVVRFQQFHEGLPVHQRGVTVVLDAAGQAVRSLQDHTARPRLAPAASDIGPEAALRVALTASAAVAASGGQSSVAAKILAGPPSRRVYHVRIPTLAPVGRLSVMVDATSGQVLSSRNEAIH